MDKFKEGIVKMSYSEPNSLLLEAKNLIHQHLDRFMSGLRGRSDYPDHHPYGLLIHIFT